MALIKFGGGITEMRGSLAGNTYSRNRYGAYMRARTKPINPNTDAQQLVRASLSSLTTRWAQTLTAGQRAAWDLYGTSVVMTNKLGESINLSGYNHFLRSNTNLVRLSLPPIDDGPVVFELPDPDPTFVISGAEATQNITATYDAALSWCIEDGGMLFMFQGSPQNAQRNFFGGPWRLWTAVEGDTVAPPAGPKIAPAVFAISEDQRVWLYARIMRADGRLSQPFRTDTFITA